LQRAFSFFERGELRELRAGDPMVFDLIVNAIEQCDALESAVHSREKDDAKISAKELLTHSLEPLSIVAPDVKVGSDSAFTLIARYKDTITEIDCVNRSDYGNQVLRSCKQLELLTFANGYDPSAWLGLSQLHTLCGVNLGIVTCAAIAAALPRLHTLDVFSYVNISSASMVGFFEDLLPRLRSFHFTGTWPHQTAAPRAAATTTMTAAPPQFLPVLRELVLVCRSIDLQVARGFMGAQPVLLRVPSALAVSYAKTPTITEAENGPPTAGLLSRVRNLTLLGSIDGPFDAARVLRAAPQLRTLTAVRMEGDFLLAAGPEGFAGLVHPWLRSIDVGSWHNIPADCVMRLRQLYFPRLQRLTIDGWMPDVYWGH
jgi:hypothetical protein